MARINKEMSVEKMVLALTDGNTGSIVVLAQLYKMWATIDPENKHGSLGAFYILDDLELYGSEVFKAFKYNCGESITLFALYLKAKVLGIAWDGNPLDILTGVRESSPKFLEGVI